MGKVVGFRNQFHSAISFAKAVVEHAVGVGIEGAPDHLVGIVVGVRLVERFKLRFNLLEGHVAAVFLRLHRALDGLRQAVAFLEFFEQNIPVCLRELAFDELLGDVFAGFANLFVHVVSRELQNHRDVFWVESLKLRRIFSAIRERARPSLIARSETTSAPRALACSGVRTLEESSGCSLR